MKLAQNGRQGVSGKPFKTGNSGLVYLSPNISHGKGAFIVIIKCARPIRTQLKIELANRNRAKEFH